MTAGVDTPHLVVDDSSERAAVAIVRAWIERTGSHGLRVRVSQTLDLETPGTETSQVVSSIDDACDIVRAWLVAFADGPVSQRPHRPRGRAAP